MNGNDVIAALYAAQNIYINPKHPVTGGAGLLQAVYLDHRNLLSFVKERDLVLQTLAKKLSAEQSFDVLAGKETGGIGLAAIMAEQLNVPMVYIRKQIKNSGTGRQVEGVLHPGSRVVIVDDTIVTGGNIERATAALTSLGVKVVGAAAISVLRDDIYQPRISHLGLKVTYLVSMLHIMDWGIEHKKINPEYIPEIKAYLADPLNWGAKKHS